MDPAFKRILKILLLPMVLLFALSNCATHEAWHAASRESARIAPNPATTEEAVIQIYGARAWGWHGWFAIHTWISAKPSGADHYLVYEVIGWRLEHGLPVVRIAEDLPDRYWYGRKPRLLNEHRGQGVDQLIIAVDHAARTYPWDKKYSVFPGPNSNTFTAWIGRRVPELKLDLPFSAIGSSYAKKTERVKLSLAYSQIFEK